MSSATTCCAPGRLARERKVIDRSQATPRIALLAVLAQINDAELIDAFTTGVSAAGNFSQGDNAVIVRALRALPAKRTCDLLQQVLQANADLRLGGCADLLARASTVAAWRGLLQGAARGLLDALPGDPTRPVAAKDAWRRKALDPAGLSHLLHSLCRIDSELAEQAVHHWLAWPKTYGFDSLIVPALRGMAEQPATRRHAAYQRLCAAAVQHLQARAAQALAAPAD